MAIILDIPGVAGSTQIDGFAGKIECSTYSHGISMAVKRPVSNTERTDGQPYHQDFTLSKSLDATTPLLNQHCCEGKIFPTVTISILRNDTGVTMPLIVYTLGNVVITSVSASGSRDGDPYESITLNYASIKWDFSTQKEEGGKKGTIQGKWDASTNKAA